MLSANCTERGRSIYTIICNINVAYVLFQTSLIHNYLFDSPVNLKLENNLLRGFFKEKKQMFCVHLESN